MSLQLLDGVSAAFNFQTDINTADLATANLGSGAAQPAATSTNFDSWKCIASYMSIDISQELLDRTTFCTQGWKGRFAALKDLQGRLDGFAAKGAGGGNIANPSYMFGTSKGIPTLATLDSGCTISFNAMAARDHSGLRAQANSERSMEFMQDSTYFAPVFVWA